MNPIRQYDPADEPLWLIIQRGAQSRCFEFPSNSHKAIVVGSSETADLRIRNIAPVAFFLERDDQSIWLTPAYPQAELRLDMTKVEGKRRIYTQGLVELGDVELRLKVRDTPPTLRSDSLMRLASEISDPVSKHTSAVDAWAITTAIDTCAVDASLRQNTTVSVPLGFSSYTMGLPIETLIIVPSNFDEWFDDAITPPPRGVADSPLLEPVQQPLTPRNSAEPQTEAVEAITSFYFIPDTKTLEMPLFVRPEVSVDREQDLRFNERCSSTSPGVKGQLDVQPSVASGGVGTAERIAPCRTIEIAAIRSSEFEPTKRRSRSNLEALRQTMTIQLGHVCKGGDTTDLEVPIVNPSGQHPAQERITPSTCDQVTASSTSAFLASEPWFQSHDSAEPVSNRSAAANAPSNFPSPIVALEKLGLLAMRRPWVVLTSAAAGSFLLMMLVFGVVRRMGNGHARPLGRVVATQPTRLAGEVQSTNLNRAPPTTDLPEPPVGSTQDQPAIEEMDVAAPPAMERKAVARRRVAPTATAAKHIPYKLDSGRFHGL